MPLLLAIIVALSACQRFELEHLRETPAKLVGNYYQVQPDKVLVGIANRELSAQMIEGWYSDNGGAEGRQKMAAVVKEAKRAGLVVNLNQESSAADKEAKLLFEIIDFSRLGHGDASDKPQLALNIKVLNKKYGGTKWWIQDLSLLQGGEQIPSPFGNASKKAGSSNK